MYIKPSSEIPLRRGQGVNYKIVAILANGTPVEIEDSNASWAKISTEQGKEGWLLKRYLTDEKPLNFMVEKLNTENRALKDQIAQLKEENASQVDTNKKLNEAIADKNAELSEILGSDVNAPEGFNLQEELKQSQKMLVTLQQQLASITAEKEKLATKRNILWFVVGAATLIVGFILGRLKNSPKKKKSLLY